MGISKKHPNLCLHQPLLQWFNPPLRALHSTVSLWKLFVPRVKQPTFTLTCLHPLLPLRPSAFSLIDSKPCPSVTIHVLFSTAFDAKQMSYTVDSIYNVLSILFLYSILNSLIYTGTIFSLNSKSFTVLHSLQRSIYLLNFICPLPPPFAAVCDMHSTLITNWIPARYFLEIFLILW